MSVNLADSAQPASCVNSARLPESAAAHTQNGITSHPRLLRIRFSDSSDIDRIAKLFEPENKKKIDPENFVRPRGRDELEHDIAEGRAMMFTDEYDAIRAFCLASTIDNQKHEIGAVMSNIRGLGIAGIAVSSLALKQQHTGSNVYSRVKRNNAPSNHVFGKSLQWDAITCPDERVRLFNAASGVLDPQAQEDRIWYHHGTKALTRSAAGLLKLASTGILKARNGKEVRMDLSGLTAALA